MIIDNKDTVQVEVRSLSPTEAILHLQKCGGPGQLIGGKLLGPTCPYTTTVQVAYPVRLLAPSEARVVVPEPNYWDPYSPLLYRLQLEVESAGRRHVVSRRIGFFEVKVGSTGLIWNGATVRLQAVRLTAEVSPDRLPTLRESRFDTVLIPSHRFEPALLEWTDCYGMWILVEVSEAGEMHRYIESSRSPSFLGFVFDKGSDTSAITRDHGPTLIIMYEREELAATGISELRLANLGAAREPVSVGRVTSLITS